MASCPAIGPPAPRGSAGARAALARITARHRKIDSIGAHCLDQAWLTSWRDELNRALERFLAAFEGRYGYRPGDNRITGPGDDQTARKINAHPDTAPDLTPFYQVIYEVLLPDIGNGYFIHPAGHVLDELAHAGPARLGASASGVVFASDGGGILYAIGADGTIYRSDAASRDSGFEVIAADLASFLDQLRQAVMRFIATGEPGQL